MTTQRERQLLEQLGNASRGVAIANQSIASVLRLFAHDGRPLRRDDLRTLGHNLVSLAGALTDLGVQMATNTKDDESGDDGAST